MGGGRRAMGGGEASREWSVASVSGQVGWAIVEGGVRYAVGMSRGWMTVLLLVGSNTFMTFAWYYHVKQKHWPVIMAIAVSWMIALPEYILQVPANRLGHVDHGGPFTLAQLKIIQEAITLVVFSAFAIFVAKEKLKTTDIIAFVLIFAAVVVSRLGATTGTPPVTPGP
jgi:uncharacterized protein